MERKKLPKITNKQHSRLTTKYENICKELESVTLEKFKLQEVLRQEEQGYLTRITNLECQLADSYIDQERLNSVINSLGQTIQNQQRILRNRVRRFNQPLNYDYQNLEASTNAVSENRTKF